MAERITNVLKVRTGEDEKKKKSERVSEKRKKRGTWEM